MLKFPTTPITDTAGSGPVIGWHVRRSLAIVVACLVTLLGASQTLTAGCYNGPAPALVEVGLHLDQLPSAQRPLAEGCWWYSGLAKIVYEEGRLKYFPVLQDTDCHGPGCRKKPAGPGLEPVAVTSQRNIDAGSFTCGFHDPRPVPPHGYLACDDHCTANPFLPGILRPPCAA